MPARLLPYAATPARALRQALADVCVVLWIAVWVVVGRAVHAALSAIADVGARVQSGAGGISSNLDEAGGTAADVPLVGDALSTPLQGAGGAARDIAEAGAGLQDRAAWLAVVLALAIAVPPILAVTVPWLAHRLRFARHAGATAALARTPGGEQLLALRALAGQPVALITRVDPDPLEAWRRDDPDVVRALAVLELRAAGLRPARSGRVRSGT